MANENAIQKTGFSKFDHLPILVQIFIMVGILIFVAIVGFAALFAIDILLLDLDPVGKFFAMIGGLFRH